MYLLDVSIRDLKYFCVLFVLFVFLFMLLALLRCYTSIFDGFISASFTRLWKLTYRMVKFSSSRDICIWRYMQTTLSLIGENIQQLYLK